MPRTPSDGLDAARATCESVMKAVRLIEAAHRNLVHFLPRPYARNTDERFAKVYEYLSAVRSDMMGLESRIKGGDGDVIWRTSPVGPGGSHPGHGPNCRCISAPAEVVEAEVVEAEVVDETDTPAADEADGEHPPRPGPPFFGHRVRRA